jgi:hypothetical protein
MQCEDGTGKCLIHGVKKKKKKKKKINSEDNNLLEQ